jgi:hypothetical protein
MTVFGIDNLDKGIGELDEGRIYLLHGAGVDEIDLSLFSLSFASVGADHQSRSAFLSDRDQGGLLDLGRVLGLDLRRLIGNETLTALRYRPFVGEKIVSMKSPGRIVYELKNFLKTPFPERIAMCPLQPFLTANTPDELMESLSHLKEALGRLQTTVLIGYPERDNWQDVVVLEQLRKISHGVFRLSAEVDGSRTIRVDKAWKAGQLGRRYFYSLRRGKGISAHAPDAGYEEIPGVEDEVDGARMLVFALDADADGNGESRLVKELGELYEADEVYDEDLAAQRLFSGRYGLLVLRGNDRSGILRFLKYLRLQDVSLAIIVLTEPIKRAAERSDILRFGADAIVYEPFHLEDVLVHVNDLFGSFGKYHVRPTYHRNKEFIRIRDKIDEQVETSLEQDSASGLWSLSSFLSIGNLILSEAELLTKRKLLVGFRIKGQEGAPPQHVARGFKDVLRQEDPLTLLPSGLFLLLVDPSGGDTARDIAAKLERGLSKATGTAYELRSASVMYPTDGGSIEELLDRLGRKLASR